MTEKQTYWLTSPEGDHGLATGADERDRWKALGWAEAVEPQGSTFIWARQDGIADAARFPIDAFNTLWSAKGWVAAMPPEPASPLNGDQVLPQPAVSSTPQAPAESTAKSTTTAAGGDTKGK